LCDRTVTEHVLFDSTTGANHLKKIVQHLKLLGHTHARTHTQLIQACNTCVRYIYRTYTVILRLTSDPANEFFG